MLDNPKEVIECYMEDPPNVYGYEHTPLYADMIESIEQNRTPYTDAYVGCRALELVLAIYESAAKGSFVDLPLESGSTTDYEGRI